MINIICDYVLTWARSSPIQNGRFRGYEPRDVGGSQSSSAAFELREGIHIDKRWVQRSWLWVLEECASESRTSVVKLWKAWMYVEAKFRIRFHLHLNWHFLSNVDISLLFWTLIDPRQSAWSRTFRHTWCLLLTDKELRQPSAGSPSLKSAFHCPVYRFSSQASKLLRLSVQVIW